MSLDKSGLSSSSITDKHELEGGHVLSSGHDDLNSFFLSDISDLNSKVEDLNYICYTNLCLNRA